MSISIIFINNDFCFFSGIYGKPIVKRATRKICNIVIWITRKFFPWWERKTFIYHNSCFFSGIYGKPIVKRATRKICNIIRRIWNLYGSTISSFFINFNSSFIASAHWQSVIEWRTSKVRYIIVDNFCTHKNMSVYQTQEHY